MLRKAFDELSLKMFLRKEEEKTGSSLSQRRDGPFPGLSIKSVLFLGKVYLFYFHGLIKIGIYATVIYMSQHILVGKQMFFLF